MKSYILLTSITLSVASFSQTSINIKAKENYDNYNYSKVITELENKNGLDVSSLRKLAESYKISNDFGKAESTYAKLVSNTDKSAQDLYAYAQVLKMNGKYEEANIAFTNYSQLNSNDSRIKLYNQNKNYVVDLLKDNGQFTVKNLEVNSPQQDFGATYLKDKIVYTSSKHNLNLTYRSWNGNKLPFLDLYTGTEDASSEIKNVEKISTLNKKYHEGPASYSRDGNTVVYTQDNYKEKSSDGIRKLELYEAKFKDGKWVDKTAIWLNNKEYSVGHPALSADGNTLYFTSDMPGGKGGTDLYKIIREANGTWGKQENLGDKINTEGNEMFPFIHESGLFFFSSDGRPGLGGLDVFATEIKHNTFTKVINVGSPVNGSKDDFSFVLNLEKTKGYFASNREGGKGDDDLYSFNLLKSFKFCKEINGAAKDKEGNILADTKVSLHDSKNNLVSIDTTTEDGEYTFCVDGAEKYNLTGTKEKYIDGENIANVTEKTDVITADIILSKDPGLSLYMLVTDAKTKQPLQGVDVTVSDLTNNSFDDFLTPSTGDHKNTLSKNKVGDNLKYKIKLEKPGYLTKELLFNYPITKPGEIPVHAAIDLSMGKIEVGSDLSKLIDIKPIYFDLGKYKIKPDAATELEKIVKVMTEYPTMVVELGSHTDCRASAKFNLKLSDNRAKASAAYIKTKIKNPERIYGKGFGESKLKNGCACEGTVMSTCSEEENQTNRRTEFIIMKM